MSKILTESLSYDQAQMVVESVDRDTTDPTKGKNLYMKGIFIQGDVRNLNERVYPRAEIEKAVGKIRATITNGHSILGELDHPAELIVNLDRVSHIVTDMWLEGANGFGKLKILDTPTGVIAKTLLENGVKLGVSSRGSGDVARNGSVVGFEIVTVDIVAKPSAPSAYPTPIYETLNSNRRGAITEDLAIAVKNDKAAQKYLEQELFSWLRNLK